MMKEFDRMTLSLPRLFVTLLAFAAPAFAATAEFPNQGLESRIEFWKKVYTQYGKDDTIIHDRIRVNLIYDVVDKDAKDARIAAIQRALDEMRTKLPALEDLSPTAQQVRETIVAYGFPITEASLADLRENV